MVNAKIDPPKIFEGETIEARWDPKKIVIGVIILSILGLLGAIMLTGIGKRGAVNDPETLGVASEDESRDGGRETPSLPTAADIETIIRETQETISNITADNLTSSQAAIQKMIQDLEILQGKKDAKDVICSLICKDK